MNATETKATSLYPQQSLGLLLAAITAFCWSVLAIVLKFALTFTDSATIVWARMFVAFILLSIFLKFKKNYSLKKMFTFNKIALFAGAFLSVNYFGYMKGIELTSASNAQVMIQMAPTLLIIIGFFYFKEKPNPIQLTGIAVAALGFYLFFQTQIHSSIENSQSYITGNIYIFVAAITWALFSTLQKIASKFDLLQFNFFVYLAAAFFLLPAADLSNLASISLFQVGILLFLGANTVIAYGCLGEAFKRAPASKVSLIIILNPLMTIFLFYLMNKLGMDFVTHESVSLHGLLGALLVICGVGMALVKK